MKEDFLTPEDGQRLQMLEELYRLAREQQECLAQDDVDGCLRCMDERETLIERFDRLGPRPAQPEPDEGRALLLAKMLRLQALDEENQRLAMEKLERYRGEVRSVRQQRRRLSSYAAVPISTDGIYIDQKK